MNARCMLCRLKGEPQLEATHGYGVEVVSHPLPLCEGHSADRPSPTFPWTEEMDLEWTARMVLQS